MPQLRAEAAASTRALERFLVADGAIAPGELPTEVALADSGLAAFASSRLPATGRKLRTALLAASARHLAIKAELQRLLRAWRAAGINALLFKGFHLAEFVYRSPGERHYSDVDVLIEQQSAVRASAIAVELGWRELWHADRPATADSLRGPRYVGHEVVQLLHPRARIQLDVHRRLVHNNHNRIGRYGQQERITLLTRKTSQVVDWEGVRVLLPHPLDAVLVGLVLNRCWSPEDWTLRPHDYLDFRYLVEKYELTLEQLRKRAEELGCSRTFELFLERCDPFGRRCILSAPHPIELQRLNLLVAKERGNRYLDRSLVSIANWLRVPADILVVLPGVAATLILVHRTGGVRQAAANVEKRAAHLGNIDALRWQWLRQSVHKCLRLLGYGGDRFRDIEAVALLAALRSRSCSATLSWTTAPSGDLRPLLELDGKPLSAAGTLLGHH